MEISSTAIGSEVTCVVSGWHTADALYYMEYMCMEYMYMELLKYLVHWMLFGMCMKYAHK